MTTQEFSIQFDILYNNLASNAAPPLNEYEKSVFLTKAQSEIVLELYSGRNQLGLSFESSEEVRKYLRPLLIYRTVPLYKNSSTITIPEDIWLITRESIGNTPVIPISQDDYYRVKENPYKGAKKNKRALRISNGDSDLLIHKEDYPESPNTLDYKVWGLQKPSPIILDGILDTTLTIDGEYVYPLDCVLPDSLHEAILDRAVLLAKQAYIGGQTQA